MESKKSYSIQDVKIPDGEWLTMIEGAAYTRTGYARFVEACNRNEFPNYNKPGEGKKLRRLVRKADLDAWVFAYGRG